MPFNYRKSTLTKMLKASFFLKSAKTVVIATVSPASKDTEHSLNTLRHACLMDGQYDNTSINNNDNDETRFITGKKLLLLLLLSALLSLLLLSSLSL